MSLEQQQAKQLTSSGIKWNLIEQMGVFMLAMVAAIILSRILLPEEFGLFGMLAVLTNLAILVVNMGLAYSVIQNKSLTQDDLSALFWFNILIGILVSVLFFSLAPYIAAFYKEQELLIVARTLCLLFVVQGASAIPLGILMKKMDFRSLALSQILATSLSYAVAIGLAFAHFGYWALVAQILVQNTFQILGNLFFSRWRPAFTFHPSAIHKIRSFSVRFSFTQFMDFAASNLDSVLVGGYVGKRQLGFMGRASALAMLPVTSFGFILNRTFFPWFSSLQDNIVELQKRYLQAAKALFLVIVPVLMLLAVTSEEVVLLLFGENWAESAPLVKIFSVYASFNCFNLFNDSFLTSQGRTDLLLQINFTEKVLLVMAVVIGVIGFGFLGVIVAKTTVTIIFFFPRLFYACRLVKTSIWNWFEGQRIIAASLLFSFIVAYLLKLFLPIDFFALKLVIVAGIGWLAFYACLTIFKEASLVQIQKLMVDQLADIWKRND